MMGLGLDDLEIGFAVELGSYAFTRENVLAFARKYDPQPFHVDDEAAAKGPFGRLAASGWHTAAAWMKCYIATLQAALATLSPQDHARAHARASPGFVNLRWPRPVYVGDTVAFTMRATAKRDLASRPSLGFAEFLSEGRNQTGELVYSFEGKVFMPKR